MIQAIDPTSREAVSWEKLVDKYPGAGAFSKSVEIQGAVDRDSLTLSWTTDIGVTGNCVLPRSKANEPSEIVPLEKDWAGFKEFVCELAAKRHLFRGQKQPWRLRTPFHRSGRAVMHRFVYQDLPVLLRHISSRTKHVFNLSVGDENGAFCSLVQHHGYPTPLLDWTFSPFVAAFFAYRGISNEDASSAGQTKKVRVFVFDQAQWKKDWQQILFFIRPELHLSICEFMAIENERIVPQQSVSTVTNIDDIEAYIQSKESAAKRYLTAIDLPVNDRRSAVRELRYMGITAGSLFPGLDGACEELKQRNFEI
jgi:FRG domain-containing protein